MAKKFKRKKKVAGRGLPLSIDTIEGQDSIRKEHLGRSRHRGVSPPGLGPGAGGPGLTVLVQAARSGREWVSWGIQ